MDDLATELQILAKDASMKVRRYMRGSARFEAMVSGGLGLRVVPAKVVPIDVGRLEMLAKEPPVEDICN